jgi:subtilisin family serine protease
MMIDRAWLRSTGSGVTVALIDTGIDQTHSQLQGWSARKVASGDVLNDTHGHGTHQAGVLGAPRDGAHVVGVAYGANKLSVKHSNDYFDVNAWRVVAAIDTAAAHAAKVVNMSFRSDNTSSLVSDAIDLHYYSSDILFVAAAGSGGWGGDLFWGVTFPALHPNVIAVSSVDIGTGWRYSGSHNGAEVELSAYHGQPTTGLMASEQGWSGSSNSSNSSTIVAGIATLVRAKYSEKTNAQVRQILRESATDMGPVGRDHDYGYGIVNAMRAVGGMYSVNASGCNASDCTIQYKLSQCTTKLFTVSKAGGDGPFTYAWSTGSSGTSTSMILCPSAGTIAVRHLYVTVTDHSDGNSFDRHLRLEVLDPNAPCPTCPQ